MKKKLIQDLLVVENKILSEKYFILHLQSPTPLPEILPGQFVQIEVKDSKNTFLRRPLSIHDVDYKTNTLKLMVQVLGEGTKKLSLTKQGEYLSLVYPLGNSFSINDNEKALLIGGGCGIAPLLYLARHMNDKGIKVTVLIGGASQSDILEADEYRKYGEVYITTFDASLGEKGLVTQHSIFNAPTFDFTRIYCCGPEPMMKALARIAREKGIDCEVSLENMMACGIGACLCCVVETQDGNKCTCTEGPVYEFKYLKGW
ncbi:MAG: dihydroorotate dehydrogenase electron transfer subunit [Bacteroidetes bacterium]|nr:dihydroorotate dehydrogenase electron transfer subunit [Bacteroidota bacterium]